MPDIRNFVGFAQNETLIKEYDGLRMYYPVRAKIGLAATNKRFIAYSTGRSFFDAKSESLFQQVNIMDITGIGVVQSKRYRPGLAALGIILLLAGAILTFIGLSGTTLFEIIGIVCIIGGIILAIAGFLWSKTLFRFEIWGNAWLITIGEFENVKPDMFGGPDLLKAIEELGAIIIELQEGTD